MKRNNVTQKDNCRLKRKNRNKRKIHGGNPFGQKQCLLATTTWSTLTGKFGAVDGSYASYTE